MNMAWTTDTDNVAAQQRARRLGRELERRRNKLGLSRFVLAQRLRMPVGVLEAWENGRTFPDASDLFAWLDALDVVPTFDMRATA